VATGDGVAIAWRAGAEISDIEFVQFHPTALYVEGAPRFLLSEALRGEGAVLRNVDGDRFMPAYHPRGELAPRDVVSRSMVAEIKRTGAHVYLDLTHRQPEFIRSRFPRVYQTCLEYGVDLTRQPAPVHPAAHYAMGGVRTDLLGQTGVPGLFAAGEAACTGVHGANRLASNSLLEGLVFGARAGSAMKLNATTPLMERGQAPPASFPCCGEDELRALAWNKCGIIRNGTDLREACDILGSHGLIESAGPSVAAHELRNIHVIVELIARCALAREESRGGHFRVDFPEKRPEFEIHSVVSRGSEVAFV
jgi:L-aspartate oxidase